MVGASHSAGVYGTARPLGIASSGSPRPLEHMPDGAVDAVTAPSLAILDWAWAASSARKVEAAKL
jgi:hypothetical protein